MSLSRATLLTAALTTSIAAVGCGGRWFASPSSFQESVATTIAGTVSGPVVSASAGIRSSARSANTASSEWTVTVVGTNVTAAIDSDGRFQLIGVPTGNLELRITGPGVETTIFITNVAPQQLIELQINVTGDGAVLLSDVRSSGKVDLCHHEGNGSYHSINVSVSAEPAHRGHGDAKVGEEVPADPAKVFDRSCRPVPPVVSVKKYTNGDDADAAPGPSIVVGSPITWQYVVTNTGTLPLTNVTVVDDKGVIVNCGGQTTLAVAAAITCTGTGVAAVGPYRNVATVTARTTQGLFTDKDASHYLGIVPDEDEEEGPKVQLCHRTGNGSYHMIEVSVNAEPAHRGHGDAKVGEAVPGQAGKTFTASCGVQ
jgi:hypothetical protein